MKLLTETNNKALSTGLLLLRCMTGLILFVAGAGKVFGWFGGMGLTATLAIFKSGMGIPAWLTYISCFTELIGGLFLILGFLTRPAAFALFINMLVATILVGAKNFFMGGGAYPCSLMISAFVIFLAGPFSFSIDALLTRIKKPAHQQYRESKLTRILA
jgi:putative oxidoreductase